MLTFEFKLKTKVMDPPKAIRAIGHWMKAKAQLEDMFPKVCGTIHYRELERFGMKTYWCDDWITKIHSLQTLGRMNIYDYMC